MIGAVHEVYPATADRWDDVVELLGRRGSVKGCWCMFFRLGPQERRTEWGEGNRQSMSRLVQDGRGPGLVAYRDGNPAGWVSLAPRAEFPRLDRSPVTKPVDGADVWSLVCFYVAQEHRGTGVAKALLTGAVDHARRCGAEILEAYPVDDTLGAVPTDAAYHGWTSLLAAAGFQEVARRSERRPVMRLALADAR